MYTRGLQDEGAQCHQGLAQRPWGIPAPAGDVVRDQTPLGWHRGTKRCHSSEEKPVPPPPRPYSLDVAVVEGAIVLHLQMKNISEDTGLGTAPLPPPDPKSGARWAQSVSPPMLVALLTRSK